MDIRISAQMIDIASPQHEVHVQISDDESVLWVNVDGKCRLRICQIPKDSLRVEWQGEPDA